MLHLVSTSSKWPKRIPVFIELFFTAKTFLIKQRWTARLHFFPLDERSHNYQLPSCADDDICGVSAHFCMIKYLIKARLETNS